MNINSACILKDRGILFVDGADAKDFLQNIITNYINKVTEIKSCFASLLNPQGKFLFEYLVFVTCQLCNMSHFLRLNLSFRRKVIIL